MIVGILGGGQLARMMALAAHPLGIKCRVYDPGETCCSRDVAEHVRGEYEDVESVKAFALSVDAVTYEFENVPAIAAQTCAEVGKLAPSARALEASQDRAMEKHLLESLGIVVARTHLVDSMKDLVAGVVELSLPCVLKTRRMGYDGRGQFILQSENDVQRAWDRVGRVPSILEAWIPFERELAMSVVRDDRGNIRAYPLVETVQHHSMLFCSHAPAHVPDAVLALAYQTVSALAERLQYVGVLTVEFFLDPHGYLIANEIAPRVHNSAHWTIEGAQTSQFENHIRAVAGLPLGATDLREETVSYNLIGREPSHAAVLAIAGAHLHSYGKSPAPGRKLGHVTMSAMPDNDLRQRASELEALVRASNLYRA